MSASTAAAVSMPALSSITSVVLRVPLESVASLKRDLQGLRFVIDGVERVIRNEDDETVVLDTAGLMLSALAAAMVASCTMPC